MAFAKYGLNFTSTLHDRPQGPTLPENNEVDSPFVVVITGAGKGLGYHIALAYARAGASGITISSRTESDLERLSKELLSINPKLEVLVQAADTSKEDDIRKLALAVEKRFGGRLDVVVANAGVSSAYLYKRDPDTGERKINRLPRGVTEDDDAARVININVVGTYLTARYLMPIMVSDTNPSKARTFIAISSASSLFENSQRAPTAYNISKIAVNRLVENIQGDHDKDGVLAFSIHPGAVHTDQTKGHVLVEGGETYAKCKTLITSCSCFMST